MLRILASSWWMLVVRGVLLLLLAILAFVNPGGTAQAFVLYSSILLMIEGVMTAISAFLVQSRDENRWFVLLEGVLTAVIGFLLFRSSVAVVLGFAFLFGAWMIFSGVMKVALAIQLRKEIEGEFWLGLAGVAGIVFGVIIFAQPGIGVATLLAIIGIFALLAGILLIALGLRLRTVQGRIHDAVDRTRDAVTSLAQEARDRQNKD